MAPALADTEPSIIHQTRPSKAHLQPQQPLRSTGVLNQYESFDVTPVIGREFPKANLVDWLKAPKSEELLRELALTISQRGVVFFRAQEGLTNGLQKELVQRLGELSGKPATSKLHIHPILNPERELGGDDPEISTISSEQYRKVYRDAAGPHELSEKTLPSNSLPSNSWHNTLWASGYEIYDRISAPYQAFLETLTATFAQPRFNQIAAHGGFSIYDKERGAPENIGAELKAVHPVVRTNPVTGWKSVFPVGANVQHINGLTAAESKALLEWFVRLLVDNHALQVRFKWSNVNDLAIWDNRSVFHTATYDYDGLGERFGNRAVGLGERPYLDPKSKSRREALAELTTAA